MTLSKTTMLLVLAFVAFSLDEALASDRVNPHGASGDIMNAEILKTDPSKSKACLGCHSYEGANLSLNSTAKAICTNCHNSGPHSGVADHAKHGVSCMNCHSFHRSLAIAWKNSPYAFQSKGAVPDGYVEKLNLNPLLKKTCTDCHKW